MKYWLFRHYWWLILVGATAAITAVIRTSPKVEWQLLLGIAGAALSGIYFVQKQRLEEMHLFKEIFTECNKRYDGLNERLNAIAACADDVSLTREEQCTLDDYFNLCAEEFLFYRTGYILPPVWASWRMGMMRHLNSKRIRERWDRERAEGSYYGLERELEIA